MINENKVYSAGPNRFTIHYLDTGTSVDYRYKKVVQPVSNYIGNIQLSDKGFRGKTYHRLNQSQLTPYQERLLDDALFGFKTYSLAQLRSMRTRERETIMALYLKTKELLRQWKEKLVNDLVDDYLKHGIPGFDKLQSKMNKALKVGQKFIPQNECVSFTFEELNITKTDAAYFLFEQGILPEDFFQSAA